MPRVWRIRCEAGDLVAQITQIDNGSLCVICDLFTFYLPKIIQSPCDVAMNSNIGNDSHVFVREAMKA